MLNSAYEHDIWDEMDYEIAVGRSTEYKTLERASGMNGYPVLFDTMMAVNGNPQRTHHQMHNVWKRVSDLPYFQRLKMSKDANERRIGIERVAQVVYDLVVSKRNPEDWFTLPEDVQEEGISDEEEAVAEVLPTPQTTTEENEDDDQADESSEQSGEGDDPSLDHLLGTFPADIDPEAESDDGMISLSAAQAVMVEEEGQKLEKELALFRAWASLQPSTGTLDVADFRMDMMRFDAAKLSKVLGWARSLFGGSKRRLSSMKGDLVGFKQGGWSDSVVPYDMLNVADGDLHTLVRLAENTLTHRRFEDEEETGYGPVIVLRDESGSTKMGSIITHPIFQQIEFALAVEFTKQKRDLVSLAFSSEQIYGRGADVSGEGWHKGSVTRRYTYVDPEAALPMRKHLSLFRGGGTDIIGGMTDALVVADEYVSGADILILTDAKLTSEVGNIDLLRVVLQKQTQAFRDEGGRIWAVVVSDEEPPARTFDGWCNGWVYKSVLDDLDDLGNLFIKMVRA